MALRWFVARCGAAASARPSAGLSATASTTTSAGETNRAELGSGGKGGSSTQAERRALAEAVGGASSSSIRPRRVRGARAGGIRAVCLWWRMENGDWRMENGERVRFLGSADVARVFAGLKESEATTPFGCERESLSPSVKAA